MNSLAIAASLADELETELPGQVLQFKTPDPARSSDPVKSPDPVTELERAADVHRRMLASYEQRKADARKSGKATVASLELDRKSLKARFDEDMSTIAEKIAEAKTETDLKVTTADKLAATSRAALAVLAE